MINPPSTSLESTTVDSRAASSSPQGRASSEARTFSDVLGELHATSSHESSSRVTPSSTARPGAPRTHHDAARAPRRENHHDSATALHVEDATLVIPVPAGPPPTVPLAVRGPVVVAHSAESRLSAPAPAPSLVESAATNVSRTSSTAVRPGEGGVVGKLHATTESPRGTLIDSPSGTPSSRVTQVPRDEGTAPARKHADVAPSRTNASVMEGGLHATTQVPATVRPISTTQDGPGSSSPDAGVTPPGLTRPPTARAAVTPQVSPLAHGSVTGPESPRDGTSRRPRPAEVTPRHGESSAALSWVNTPTGDLRSSLKLREVTPTPTSPSNPAPSGTHAGPTLFDASRFVSDVTRTLVGEGDYRVTLALHPDQLGTVRATITLSGSELTVAMTPDSRQGHEALSHELDGLRGELSRGGLNVNVTLHDHRGTRHPNETPQVARRVLSDVADVSPEATPSVAIRPTSDGQIHVVL